MEFKYRSVDDPASPIASFSTSMPTAQGLIYGGESRTTDLVQWTRRDLLRREMEAQVREEMMAMRREIEDQVRMEMAIERELALRTQAGRISPSSSQLPLQQQQLQRTVRLPASTRQLQERVLTGISAPISSRNNLGAVTKVVGNGIARSVSDVRGREEEPLCKSPINDIVSDLKRKATSDDGKHVQTASPKKARTNWSCDLCGVINNSESSFKEHLEGKKHRSREKRHLGRGFAGNAPASSEAVEREDKEAERDGTGVGKGLVSPLKCSLCDVICNSEFMLATHIIGKKHVALLKRLARDHEAATEIATGLKDACKSEEEVAQTAMVEVEETSETEENVEFDGGTSATGPMRGDGQ